jgi:hypothetical protein
MGIRRPVHNSYYVYRNDDGASPIWNATRDMVHVAQDMFQRFAIFKRQGNFRIVQANILLTGGTSLEETPLNLRILNSKVTQRYFLITAFGPVKHKINIIFVIIIIVIIMLGSKFKTSVLPT